MLGWIIGGAGIFAVLPGSAIPFPDRRGGPVPTRISFADEIGSLQRDFLRDHAADREAEHIRLVQTKVLGLKAIAFGAHLLERGRDLAGAAGKRLRC